VNKGEKHENVEQDGESESVGKDGKHETVGKKWRKLY